MRRKGAWHGRCQQQRRDSGWAGPTARAPPRYGRPPPSPSAGMLHCPIPMWEKNFCTEVCRIPWHRICDVKNVIEWYDDIVKWNDSAGEEAFRNAKARYWAEINGLHCNLPLPDPDMHIDMVGDDAYIDLQLVEDLEDVYKQPSSVSSTGASSSVADKPIVATGWFELKEPGPHECPIPSVVGDSDGPVPMNDTKPEPHTVNADCGDASKLVSRDEGGGKNGNSLNTPVPTVADVVPMIGRIDIKDIVPDGWGDETEAEPVNGDNNTNSGNEANLIEWIDIKNIVPDGWGDETEAEPVNGDNNGNSANSISQDKVCADYVCSIDPSNPVSKDITAWKQNSGWGSRVVHKSCDASNQNNGWDGGVLQDSSCVCGRDKSWVNRGECSWRHWENKTNEPERRHGRKQNRNHFGSRYANLRFQGEDRRTLNNLRNCRGKKQTHHGYDSVR